MFWTFPFLLFTIFRCTIILWKPWQRCLGIVCIPETPLKSRSRPITRSPSENFVREGSDNGDNRHFLGGGDILEAWSDGALRGRIVVAQLSFLNSYWYLTCPRYLRKCRWFCYGISLVVIASIDRWNCFSSPLLDLAHVSVPLDDEKLIHLRRPCRTYHGRRLL